jgi:hypothetical protein
MSVPAAADGGHEFVVAPELADVVERLGVPLHIGDRIRFKVIKVRGVVDDAPARREPGPSAWVDSITAGGETWPNRPEW